jgi:hypothetical protein
VEEPDPKVPSGSMTTRRVAMKKLLKFRASAKSTDINILWKKLS